MRHASGGGGGTSRAICTKWNVERGWGRRGGARFGCGGAAERREARGVGLASTRAADGARVAAEGAAGGANATCGSAATVVLTLPQEFGALPVLLATLALVQGGARDVWVLTGGTCGVGPAELVTPSHAGSWGLSRSAR